MLVLILLTITDKWKSNSVHPYHQHRDIEIFIAIGQCSVWFDVISGFRLISVLSRYEICDNYFYEDSEGIIKCIGKYWAFIFVMSNMTGAISMNRNCLSLRNPWINSGCYRGSAVWDICGILSTIVFLFLSLIFWLVWCMFFNCRLHITSWYLNMSLRFTRGVVKSCYGWLYYLPLLFKISRGAVYVSVACYTITLSGNICRFVILCWCHWSSIPINSTP